jgi:two-component system sensor histidine kinase CpxA
VTITFMRSLFLKIFLWFWLAMIVIGFAVAWTTATLSNRDEPPAALVRAHEVFQRNADEAHRMLSRDGIEGLRAWRSRASSTRHTRIFVLDASGNELLGQTLPQRLVRKIERAPPAATPGAEQPRRLRTIVRTVRTPDGRDLRLAAAFDPPGPLWLLVDPLRVAVALAVSGLVCLWLARYLTAPVRRVREATARLADGELGARVGPAIGRRRDEIADLARDFDRMAERLQEAMTAQQQLLADVSHELRSPLARLHVALELARNKSGAAATVELDRIEREAEQLNELIGEVLTLSRLEAGVAARLDERIDLGGLVTAVADDARFEARASERDVSVRIPQAVTVAADAALLQRAVENVLRNGVRHTPAGTTVEVALERLQRTPSWCAVSVRDHGPGVPEQLLERIFEPFSRVSTARERPGGGTGLGLAIARRAVAVHGGRIQARNAPGGGLEVRIELPVVPPDRLDAG